MTGRTPWRPGVGAPAPAMSDAGTQPAEEGERTVSSCVGLVACEGVGLEQRGSNAPTTDKTRLGFSFTTQVIYGRVNSSPQADSMD